MLPRTTEERAMAVEAGLTLGSYELVERLGRGGMGEVWVARHRLLERPSAVKVIRASALGDTPEVVAMLLKRFAREAQATSRLSSPHTVQIHDFGTTDEGHFYYVMELLDGVDLESLVRQHGPVPPERAVHLLLQACESLAEAHRAGLIHRDVRPANLVVCRVGIRLDFVKLLDFGLVKSLDGVKEDTQLTGLGAAAGSPAFMAPEVVLGDAVDGRADVYALGAVAYWLLTGRLVFDEKNAVRTLMAHVQTPPEPPSRYAPAPPPPALEALGLSCLAKAPADRPASVEAVAAALAALPLATPWTDARASAWWQAHRPAPRVWAQAPPIDEHADTAPQAAMPMVQRSTDGPSGPPQADVKPVAVQHTPPLAPASAVPSALLPPAPTRAAAPAASPAASAGPAPRPASASPPGAAPPARAAAPASASDLGASRVPRAPRAPVDAERDRAVGRLQDAFGQGDLSLSEFDERLELAERARNQLELEVVTRDLPVPAASAPAPTANLPAPAPAPLPALVAELEGRRSQRLFAVFGGTQRKGAWVVPPKVKVRALFGGVDLDLTRAQFTADVTEFHCHAVFGGISIIVPPDVYVEVLGTALFGGFDQEGVAEPATARRVLRVSGLALFGGVSVTVRDPDAPKGLLARLKLKP